jgi:hypothetical protein
MDVHLHVEAQHLVNPLNPLNSFFPFSGFSLNPSSSGSPCNLPARQVANLFISAAASVFLQGRRHCFHWARSHWEATQEALFPPIGDQYYVPTSLGWSANSFFLIYRISTPDEYVTHPPPGTSPILYHKCPGSGSSELLSSFCLSSPSSCLSSLHSQRPFTM